MLKFDVKMILIERFKLLFFSEMCNAINDDFTPQCCKSKINCCLHFVVEPMVILGSMVGNRGTRKFEPNLDDPNDLYAYTIRPHQHPIFPQQIPTM